MIRQLISPSLGIGMFLGSAGLTLAQNNLEPGKLAISPAVIQAPTTINTNQRTASAIAEALKENAQIRQYRVQISCVDGIAELSGQVATQAQRTQVLQTASGVAGVVQVRDRIEIADGNIVRTQAQMQPTAMQGIPPFMQISPMPSSMQPPMTSGIFQPPMQQPLMPPPLIQQPAPQGPGLPPEPMSIMPMQPGPNTTLQPPPLPPYAWPTYAPYNNYSRVAAPTQYPYDAFPFIGPTYPYPKIPLGWRSVNLSWRDGSWWYGRQATGHDWWRIRYF